MLSKLALAAAGFAGIANAVTSLVVKNNYFVNSSTGKRFQIVGVDYQPGGSAGYDPARGIDPLSNGEACKRDAALMQVMGVNTIRVYNLNPDLNHDECASVFNAAGMYMVLDVNSPLPGESLPSFNPWEGYYEGYVNRTFAVVEAFKNYPNTLLFFSGNEVMNNAQTGAVVPPYLRALTRDLKQYIAKNSQRSIPVGYSAADVRDILFDSWNYLQCSLDGTSGDMSRSDIFALNSYSWCGQSTYTESGYDQLVKGFTGSSVPIFYSEYGCNKVTPRPFTEIQTIYGTNMTPVFSGGLVYEYSQETSNFGLVNVLDNGTVQLLQDYKTLSSQYAALDWSTVQGETYSDSTAVTKIPKCSSSLITTQGFNNNFTLLPSPPGVADLISNGISPKPSGKIVDISDYSFSYSILDTNGKQLSGIKVNALSDGKSNGPGTNAGIQVTNSSSNSSSSSTTKKNEAIAGVTAPLMNVVFAVIAGMVALM